MKRDWLTITLLHQATEIITMNTVCLTQWFVALYRSFSLKDAEVAYGKPQLGKCVNSHLDRPHTTSACLQKLSVDWCKENNFLIRNSNLEEKKEKDKASIYYTHRALTVATLYTDVVYHEHQPGTLNRGVGLLHMTRYDSTRHDTSRQN